MSTVQRGVSFDGVNYIPVSFSQARDRAFCISLAICDYHVWCHLSLLSVLFIFLTEHLIPVSFLFLYSVVRLSHFVWHLLLFFCFILAVEIATCSFLALQSLLLALLWMHYALFLSKSIIIGPCWYNIVFFRVTIWPWKVLKCLKLLNI